MAKARAIESLQCDSGAATAAAIVLRTRLDEMLAFQGAAAMPDGVDGLHDMRVASRRFRSLLRDFSSLFEKKRIEPVKKDAKILTTALGRVRDHDVFLNELAELRTRAPNGSIQSGISALLLTHRDLRSNEYRSFLAHLSPLEISRLSDGLTAALQAAKAGSDDEDLWQTGKRIIGSSLARFLDLSEHFFEPLNTEALHNLRISVKRLRYNLELFDICSHGALLPYAKKLKKIQSVLGDLHDRDLWIGQIGSRIDSGDIHPETAEWLVSQFLNPRTEQYTETIALWNNWNKIGLTVGLRFLIDN